MRPDHATLSARFHRRLRELRVAAGLTQTQLAETAGVATSAYSTYELGQRYPTIDTAYRLADALGVSLAAFAAAPRSDDTPSLPGRGRPGKDFSAKMENRG